MVRISVGIRNLGPDPAPGHAGVMGPSQSFTVTLPKGTKVVGDPGGCAAPPQPPPYYFGGTAEGCQIQPSGLPAGRAITLVLNVRIVRAPTAAGSVTRHYGPGESSLPDGDIDPSNNSASIVITATGDTLPATGTNVAALAGVGVSSIVAGALLVTLVRRRRRRSKPSTSD